MKVGIMSMQRIVNYGSFLQAYGLKNTIESMGHEVEFVDYFPESPVVVEERKQTNPVLRKLKNVVKMCSASYRTWRKDQIRSNETFAEFIRAYQNEWLPLLGVTDKKNYCPKLDVLVIGSDEVFNCTQPGESVGYSRQLFGKDHHAQKLLSYAATFGSTTMDKLERYQIKEEVVGLLNGFDTLSVRDTNSAQMVKQMTGKEVPIHIDPVLLYPFLEVKDIKIPQSYKDYIVVYAYSGRLTEDEITAVKAFAKKTGKKLISLGYWQTFCDDYVLASPLEVLAYIRNADYVITDTFHGTVFSIVTKKKFGTIIRTSNSQKIGSLLKLFGLESREIRNLADIEKVVTGPINFEEVDKVLDLERKHALEYLRQAI